MRVSMFSNRIYLLLLFLSFQACIPEEDPVAPFDRGDMNTESLDMGLRFSKMIFYSLSEQKIIDSCELEAWDLFLEEDKISLNPSRFMSAARVGNIDFDEQSDTLGLIFTYDPSTGSGDFALKANDELYVLNMGISGMGDGLGFLKLKIKDEGSHYLLRYADLNEDSIQSLKLDKGQHYSIGTQQEYDLLDRSEYDFVFTRYPYFFELEQLHYLVTGTLSGDIEVLEVNDFAFEEIDYAFYEERSNDLSDDLDVIGYDWKEYNFDDTFYYVQETKSFIIRDAKGFVYKMRFTSYYDEKGESGHPSFEYILL